MNEQDHITLADDLDWQAFRFVAGEMDPDEAADFELRLAEEQTAREAVAGAVETSCAVKAAFDIPAEPKASAATRESAWLRRLAWAAIGVAASVVVLIGYHQVNPGAGDVVARPSDDGAAGRHDVADDAKLSQQAIQWSQMREAFLADSEAWLGSSEAALMDAAGTTADDSGGRLGRSDLESLLSGTAQDDVSPFEGDAAADSLLEETPSWMLAGVAGLDDGEMPEVMNEQHDAPDQEEL